MQTIEYIDNNIQLGIAITGSSYSKSIKSSNVLKMCMTLYLPSEL